MLERIFRSRGKCYVVITCWKKFPIVATITNNNNDDGGGDGDDDDGTEDDDISGSSSSDTTAVVVINALPSSCAASFVKIYRGWLEEQQCNREEKLICISFCMLSAGCGDRGSPDADYKAAFAVLEAVKKYNIPMVPGIDEAITDVAKAKAIAKKIGFPILKNKVTIRNSGIKQSAVAKK